MAGDNLDLFPGSPEAAAPASAPLADRMRPRSLDELVGQPHLAGAEGPLRGWQGSGALPSLLLWGPPGSGKTTLARILGRAADLCFVQLSAVTAGVKDIRAVVEGAQRERRRGLDTLLFIDEIHRWSRSQQDALLPHVESGALTLIGATTENPSFQVVAPLLSRCRVFSLRRLEPPDLIALLRRALEDPERGLGAWRLEVSESVLAAIADAADGDARRALGLLEATASLERSRAQEGHSVRLTAEGLQQAAGQRVLLHDRDREEHYNVTSALIKSLRAGDPDAAVYYLARLLDAGDDPLFVARRLVIFAAEDVGNAEPQALGLATSAYLAVERIGLPEGRIPLAQAATFLACAPKSRASMLAIERASQAVAEGGSLPVPMHLRNAPTPLMKQAGYGRHAADPENPGSGAPPGNLPPGLGDASFYEPEPSGAETEVAARLRARRDRRGNED